MKFSIEWLKDYVAINDTPEALAERITLHSFEVEGLEKHDHDILMDVSFLPNRFPDAANYYGFAREVSAVTGVPLIGPHSLSQQNPFSKKKWKQTWPLEVQNADDCPRYSGLLMKGVRVEGSPTWLRERLEINGLRSINTVVDITNYVMLELGQPLHAFDAAKVDNGIVVRRARGREHMTTLDGKDVDLSPEDLVIADQSNVLALAGIKGGKAAEIISSTTSILLEAANFNADFVLRTARRVGITTDASYRFKYGLDPNLTEVALARAAELVKKICGGSIETFADAYPHKVLPRVIAFDPRRYEALIGEPVSLSSARSLFKRLGWGVVKAVKGLVWVEVPTFRRDVERFEDVVEEVARLRGYEELGSIPPVTVLLHAAQDESIAFSRSVKKRMLTFGFDELYSYSFIPESWNVVCDEKTLVQLENPVSTEYFYLRPLLLLSLFRALESNAKFFSSLRFYEIGKAFTHDEEAGIVERAKLAGMVMSEEKGGASFYELKGVLDALFQGYGIADVEYCPSDAWKGVFAQGQVAELMVDGTSIGFLGMIDSKWLSRFGVARPVAAFELDLELLCSAANEEREFVPLPKYPAVIRDVSFLIDTTVRIDDMRRVINDAGSKMLQDVDLFDMFEDEKLGTGKKSISFHLTFRSDGRTLTSEEVGHDMETIIAALQKQFAIEVR
ncbi:MAG: phenylalanine--tRNA ligase subunit beta [Patescibacteria group bacterium]|nr:phenylalanine--tRNA ligase subunit beta [Patescibacteria group bacterium]MDE2438078.1 phenylalanine--tRNA ligase subunit beta [Patescibacteria group bacterium]